MSTDPRFLLQDERRILTQRAKIAQERHGEMADQREAAYAVLGATMKGAEEFRSDVIALVRHACPNDAQRSALCDAIHAAYGRRLGGTE